LFAEEGEHYSGWLKDRGNFIMFYHHFLFSFVFLVFCLVA
jgi:hypothetical protein